MSKTLPEKEKALIEDLKYENQMNNLQPWIKALYKQTEKDPANPGGWSKWSLRPSFKIVTHFPKNSAGAFFIGDGIKAMPLDGGGRQEVLDKLIDTDENKNWEKYGLPLCYPYTSPKTKPTPTTLTEEEKRFVLLCNTVLGSGFTEEEFLGMSEEDKKGLWDRIIGA